MMKSGVTYICRTVPSARMDTPHSTRILLLLLLLAPVLVLVLAAGCATTPPSGGTVTPVTTPVTTPATTEVQPTPTADQGMSACSADSDCVPAQCCHPTSCINKAFKGVCTLLCTAVCEGPLDCGAGHCGCVGGRCTVVPGPGP